MGKQFWAALIKRGLITSTVVFVAGYSFESSTSDSVHGDSVESGLIAVALYLVACIVLMTLHAISGGLYLMIFGGSDMEQSILEDLRRLRILAPRSFDRKTMDYLADLADDDDAPAPDRVKAATLFGSYSTVTNRSGIFFSLAFRKAADAAILRYYQEAPARAE